MSLLRWKWWKWNEQWCLGGRANEWMFVEGKVAKIVCTKGHKVIESKKRSLNDCQNSLHAWYKVVCVYVLFVKGHVCIPSERVSCTQTTSTSPFHRFIPFHSPPYHARVPPTPPRPARQTAPQWPPTGTNTKSKTVFRCSSDAWRVVRSRNLKKTWGKTRQAKFEGLKKVTGSPAIEPWQPKKLETVLGRAVQPLHHHPSVKRPAAVRLPRPLPPFPSSLRPETSTKSPSRFGKNTFARNF